jgi:Ca2+-dependent lipid-binding protein
MINKNQSSIDLEVSRMRPRNIKQERERLYDDALRQKMISNLLKDENVKLKTKVHILESEITRKEKLVDDLLLQADTNAYGVNIANVQQSGPKLKLESHLTTNLKKKIRELQ